MLFPKNFPHLSPNGENSYCIIKYMTSSLKPGVTWTLSAISQTPLSDKELESTSSVSILEGVDFTDKFETGLAIVAKLRYQ